MFRVKCSLRVLLALAVIQIIILYVFIFFGNWRPDTLKSISSGRDNIQRWSFKKETANEDMKLLSGNAQIYVVEEHQDVIPYWLQAAENGSIGTSGNTLIHIDAHQDGAPPPFANNFPLKWPKKLTSDIYASMMTSNDVFILSSIAMGLINQFIWIKPSWINGYYVNMTFELGITDYIKSGRTFCFCEWQKNKTKASSKRKSKDISGMSHKEGEDVGKGRKDRGHRSRIEEKPQDCIVWDRDTYTTKPVSYKNCEIKAKYRYYEVSERRAIKLLSALRKKEQRDPRIILDIDEDYFGVMNRIKTYVNDGGNETIIPKIDDILVGLFCPKTGEENELKANKFMLEYIHSILAKCHTGRQKCSKRVLLEIGKKLFGHDKNMVNELFCNIDNDGKFLQLSKLLWSLPKKELLALLKIKFCNYMYFKEDEDIFTRAFQTCKGTGNHAITKYYVANETEMSTRVKRFEDIVSFIIRKYSSPGLTTVCRSMRDGYTPAKHFQSIEKYIQSALRSAFSYHTNANVHYDNKLLFGSTGWTIDDANDDSLRR